MLTYAQAGVDEEKTSKALRFIIEAARKTFEFRKGKLGEPGDIGHYSALLDFGNYYLAITTDGVGTKVLVAEAVGKFDTIGIDMIAMNVNDLICVGAEPIALVDYFAIKEPNERVFEEVAKGLYKGAKEAGIAIVGGETAVMPDLVNGYDLAGTAIGIVEKDKVITGEKIRPGDAVIGISSSGIHSNGLTLARKLLIPKYGLDYEYESRKLWEWLLEPTRIYVKPILELLKSVEVHGLAHITGGGLLNLKRITNYGFRLNMPPINGIFKLIHENGVPLEEMFRVFNMGVGFVVVVSQEDKEEALQILNRYYESFELGTVSERPGIIVENYGVKFI
ncbi:phosphoribosylformylglycinamidine cyclo-ligase [Pyrococcus furiosus DSM 3638]|uniref:Phosphoribosylformylglycinamidine cyclo-ligase n=3 Tax=Pyrococcus furiosus TaxID=2261 RepID=PUR5_PYRFU|nr:phosphoribosylformylglycinamidine cyclo-ligase [Pyrococcus furiosus]Q8U3M6.1 RecName: Full=Phosphoribosylformylglycinamidine cyclo-ligase; AltName: Full=AIR synthase; AltName: Full=AIRS; AltName: Full=Phosphoribosyl-aminoimidazole synthetase [Pyrococcus furiosus DSM 3638]AAL80555.1 phosphoribosylformylglycinamidine cyclo-ligase [Pyrococcus furiosus DSM 3638]AFN03222.1 phosphoribosylaminoimidazole synthetase [Pyrococcus furiosus COM1]QEK78143.1 phosphoribosylformylglycinamidine cyclo-ligase [